MICKCGWKHTENACPMCGEPVDKPIAKVTYLRARSNGKTNMAALFRRFVEQRFPGYNGYPVECENCGKRIHTLKFDNISHTEGRGAHPEKAEDFNNLLILCSATDFWGQVDTSCHTLWERKRFTEYKAKAKK